MSDDVPPLSEALSDPDTVRALHQGRVRSTSASAEEEETPADEKKEEASEWLGDLMLLQGVPFPYLVPDDRVLPTNSLRFFHVDRNWVRALLEGAISTGRDHAADEAHDEAFVDDLLEAAKKAATTVRARLLGQAPPDADDAARVLDREPDEDEPPEGPSRPKIPTMSGFLLRSAAVSDWPGLRAKGTDGTNPLPLLRFERLSETILLGIFKGTLRKLRLGRGVETLHFGLEREGEGDQQHWAVSLHDPDTGKPKNEPLSTKGAMRNDRTIQASQLDGKLADHFGQKKSAFTSADFALQLVQPTREVWFRPKSNG